MSYFDLQKSIFRKSNLVYEYIFLFVILVENTSIKIVVVNVYTISIYLETHTFDCIYK